ncbi:conjugal transfer protein TraH, partial [Escherichia coli]
CQAAQGIIGGLWPVTQVSQQKICQDIAGETNMFSDWAASRQGCTVGGQGDKVTAKAGDAEKDQVLKNKNLIWDTLSKNGLLGNDRALKELVMSTVGSIIFNKNGDVTILTPLVDNRDLIKVLMRGGTAKVYGCDESTLCLGPVVTNLTISESNALVTLVKNLMLSMQNKLVDDTALTDQEKGFVNTTSVPVLKYLTNAQSMGMSATYLLQVSDFIAQDLMIQYLQELVKQASLSLAGKNFPEEAAAKLRDNIIHAQGLLADMKLQSAADQNALDGITLSVNAGQRIAILGRTGCGKSTLLQLLTRAWDPQRGQIRFNNTLLTDFSEQALRKTVSVVPQRVHLFSATLRDNLLLAAPEASDDALRAVLEQVGLHKLLEGDGLNSWLGEGGRQLSGGELRRLAIARALLHDAPLMLLDEPTEGLDATTESQILDLLANVMTGKTVLMVTHRLRGLASFDRIIVMDNGHIIEQGSHAELLAKQGRYFQFKQRL